MVGLSLAEEGPLVVLEEEAVEEGDMVVDMVVEDDEDGAKGGLFCGLMAGREFCGVGMFVMVVMVEWG